MEYPRKGITISDPPEGKVLVPILIFKVGMRLPTMDFFDEIVCQYGFREDGLTLNAVNRIVGFELVCRDLGVLLQFQNFKDFFNSSTQSGVCTFSQRRGVNAFIINQKSPKKNW